MRNFMSMLLACSIITHTTLAQAPVQWVTVTSGSEIPANAVQGGQEADGTVLYVAVAFYNNQWHAGKTRKDWSFANIAYGDNEINCSTYKVLVGDRDYWWQYTQPNVFYSNAITPIDRNGVYVCRCEYAGGTQVGATWQGAPGCMIGYGGKTYAVEKYSLLFQPVPPAKIEPDRKPESNVTTNTNRSIIALNDLLNQRVILRPWSNTSQYILSDIYNKLSAGLPGNGKSIVKLGMHKGFTNTGAETIAFYYGDFFGYLKFDGSQLKIETSTGADASFLRVAGLAGEGFSYESVSNPGYYLALKNDELTVLPATDDNGFRGAATFMENYPAIRTLSLKSVESNKYLMANTADVAVADLPDLRNPRSKQQAQMQMSAALDKTCPECVSIGRIRFNNAGYTVTDYLYESNFGLLAKANVASAKPRESSFRRVPGLAGVGYSYESAKYPGYYIRVAGNGVVLGQFHNSIEFRRAASFYEEVPGIGSVRAPQF